MFRAVAVLLSSNLSRTLLGMLRSLLAAALISLEDFGIAATFMVAMAVIEMASALGLKQQIVQAREGNDPHFQAALQGFQLLRGGVNALVLVLLAWPLAALFGQPDLLWAYQVVAVVPLIGAFAHFDVVRNSRQMNYVPTLVSGTVPALVSLLSIWPLYLIFGDFRVLLYALVIQAAVSVLATHLVADRPYRLRFDRRVMANSLRFGWPLMLNGLLMFAIFNGDRMIVGREMGMAALAIFSMALSLALSPSSLVIGVSTQFFLPQLSASKDDTAQFARLCHVTSEAYLAVGSLFVVAMALFAGPFILFALGDKYAASIPILGWIALMQGVRIVKGASSVIALSKGQTGNGVITNIPRVAMLIPAWYIVTTGGTLEQLVFLGILGEILGFLLGFGIAASRIRFPLQPLLFPFLYAATVFLLAGVYVHQAPSFGTTTSLVLISLMIGGGLVVIWRMRSLRRYISARTLVLYDDA